MAQKQIRAQRIFAAKSAFYLPGIGHVQPGDTAVEGHPILKGRVHLFTPFVPRFNMEPEPEPELEPTAAGGGEA